MAICLLENDLEVITTYNFQCALVIHSHADPSSSLVTDSRSEKSRYKLETGRVINFFHLGITLAIKLNYLLMKAHVYCP